MVRLRSGSVLRPWWANLQRDPRGVMTMVAKHNSLQLASLLLMFWCVAGCGGSSTTDTPAAAASTAGGAAVAATAPAETVALTFGWPAGSKFQVEHEMSQSDGQQTEASKMTMDVAVEAVEGGLQVSVSNAVFTVPPGGGRELPPGMLETMTALVPSYRVNAAGDFVEVVDAQARYDAAMAKLEMPEPLKKMLFGQYQPDAVAASAKREWDWIVARWKGRDLALGTPVEETSELELPNAPGTKQSTTITYTAQRVGCNPADQATSCVAISGKSVLGGPELARAMEAGTAKMGLKVTVNDAKIEQSFELIAHPGTLVPHKLVTTTAVEADQVIFGEAQKTSTVATETRTYRY